MAKYLFTPLAITVSLAMIGSRFISMTLVPIMAAALLKGKDGIGEKKVESLQEAILYY
ncbi:MAG: efflux RND transporter permease subunit [Ginsengibacter sp.]